MPYLPFSTTTVTTITAAAAARCARASGVDQVVSNFQCCTQVVSINVYIFPILLYLVRNGFHQRSITAVRKTNQNKSEKPGKIESRSIPNNIQQHDHQLFISLMTQKKHGIRGQLSIPHLTTYGKRLTKCLSKSMPYNTPLPLDRRDGRMAGYTGERVSISTRIQILLGIPGRAFFSTFDLMEKS